ncbi:uncharacterized protein LOC142504880 [Primulina tabacum]|uniref:uncharacterized protein LOC142504880 n=1 Tax=Primulina tabacum TaxID=48773 RepID=UPI003F5A5831
MIKWTAELGEYDIEYKPRVAIKAQALLDFLSKMVQPEKEKVWRVFVDWSSSLVGCGVGVVSVSPLGEKIKLALRIDSRIKDVYEAKDDMMLKYLQLIHAQAKIFMDWSIEQIPREENGEADALAKMAASLSEVSTREVLHVSRLVLFAEEEILPISEDTWMTPLIKFIVNNELPEDKARAQKIKRQAHRFVLSNNVLYMRSFQGPLLKCLSEGEVDYVLREIHDGCCAEHLGGISLARKTMLAGFWLPTLSQDSTRVVQACEGCQHHSNFQHSPATLMKPIWASCPFDQWSMNIAGPFPIVRAQKKFLLVAVDYFSKWVKAEPLTKITKQEVLKFLWKNIVCRFGVPRRLISDNGRQFQGKEITSWCREMKITQSFTSVVLSSS